LEFGTISLDDLRSRFDRRAKPEFCKETYHERRNLAQTMPLGNEREVGVQARKPSEVRNSFAFKRICTGD
jgi:hypothetical protein